MRLMNELMRGSLRETDQELHERKSEMSRMNDFMKGGLK